MMKRFVPILVFVSVCGNIAAQDAGTFLPSTSVQSEGTVRFIPDTTVTVKNFADINDYSLIGVNCGVTFSQMSFNPPVKQTWLFNPMYFSVMYTHYMKMFGYMPYFGYQFGLAYGKEGYRFKENKETGVTYRIDGATQAVFEEVEVPFLAHFHFDALHFKLMANAGLYAGYRWSIRRTGPEVSSDLERSFKDTDRQPDYGLQGGVGIGFVFTPLEFHVNAAVRYSWSSIYTPDSSPSKWNQYYYRFAYPFDVMISAGLHIHLTKRFGRTAKDLKRQAREIVENGWELEYGDTESKNR